MLNIKVIKLKAETGITAAEDTAADELEKLFKEEVKSYPDAKGDVYIFSRLTLTGYPVKDIDLLVIGCNIKKFTKKMYVRDKNNDIIHDTVNIESFCSILELKQHPYRKVKRIGTDYFVEYKGSQKNVTSQSEDQKYSLYNYFKDNSLDAPYITNLIWFQAISRSNLDLLCSDPKTNALPSDLSLIEIIQKSIYQQNLNLYQGSYHLNCSQSPFFEDNMKTLLLAKKECKGLTRRKLELLISEEVKKKEGNDILVGTP